MDTLIIGRRTFTFLILFPIYIGTAFYFSSCSLKKQISKSAQQVINDSSLLTAHVGISIYEPGTNKYWYNYNGNKYFVPASNTKIPTCYAAMKYMGDSLPGLKYSDNHNYIDLFIIPTGDPTFLHPDFKNHPVYDFLNHTSRWIQIVKNNWKSDGLGSGWSWNDYNEPYMTERSAFPVYGNCLQFYKSGKGLKISPSIDVPIGIYDLIEDKMALFRETYVRQYYIDSLPDNFYINRDKASNIYELLRVSTKFSSQSIPFIPDDTLIVQMLKDTLKEARFHAIALSAGPKELLDNLKVIYSQPTDSLLKLMMHRSDNFFAEQSLLMVGNQLLGVMNDEKIIDTLLKTDFKDIPQKPRWADGSGLSRYNLFTPQDFVFILNKMEKEFGMERIKTIFPTGGEGTITSYYKAESGYIYAKTGTLSGVVALSGFLYTKKNKLLVFSVLINNHSSSATAIRCSVEKFLKSVRKLY